MRLNEQQNSIYNHILCSSGGTHVVQGVPGSGKTILAKKLAVAFQEQGKSVLLCASTGAAATRMSKTGCTLHSLFKIPTHGQLPTIQPSDPCFQKLLNADVILVDEYSMITNTTLSMMFHRLRKITASTLCDMNHKIIVFFGDPAQLPPVCYHSTDDPDSINVCTTCHITANPLWATFQKHYLTDSVRHAGDHLFLGFLNYIRCNTPSNQLIQSILGHLVLERQDVDTYLDETCTVLCTHREDTRYYNNHMLLKMFPPTNIHPTPMLTNAANNPDLKKWLQEDKFETLHGVAVGARVVLQSNLDLSIGAANGAMGNVKEIRFRNHEVYGIVVELDSGATLTVYRMHYKYTHHQGNRYFKSTFPLALGYAITGHKSQGSTIPGKVLLHIRSAFCPGLLYVMLSRVLHRSQIRIINHLDATFFKPVPTQFLS